jgi:hypothetical protein
MAVSELSDPGGEIELPHDVEDIDLEALAEMVVALLKRELLLERERQG